MTHCTGKAVHVNKVIKQIRVNQKLLIVSAQDIHTAKHGGVHDMKIKGKLFTSQPSGGTEPSPRSTLHHGQNNQYQSLAGMATIPTRNEITCCDRG